MVNALSHCDQLAPLGFPAAPLPVIELVKTIPAPPECG
jgi:hypothetical protein